MRPVRVGRASTGAGTRMTRLETQWPPEARGPAGVFEVSDLTVLPQNLHDSLGADARLGEGIRRTGDGLHGGVEVIHVGEENDHVPGCELTSKNAPGPYHITMVSPMAAKKSTTGAIRA